jgi:serine/threonine-protein kinase PknG
MTTAVTACGRPGCAGTIDDGYCNICGLAAAPVGPSRAASGPTAPSGRSTGSASGRTGSVSGRTGSASGRTGSVSGRTGSVSGRHTRPSGGRSSRGHLGAGLVQIAPIPARDPASVVLADPQVPERKRFCGHCGRPVGRGRDGQPGLAEGFCPQCGNPFSFTPKLVPGEMVGGQYEVIGCLAHGGLGWIYLASDHSLGNRWVVLKGLLNSGDADAQQAALAERQFLAEVEHPNIVGVYNFVQHADRQSGEAAGYIVMEYVGGKSLKEILLEQRRAGQSLPLPAALAYSIELLPALGYLHSRGLVYCDFKPENAIQTEEQLKLIDMGGVRRIDDEDSPIYGTVGYQAPEIATEGPSPSSDLYTVGRALAVLTFNFTGYQTEQYAYTLPDQATVPLLAEQESFFRALRRATDPQPAGRFASAGEMAEQLTGVLREVLAAGDQQPRPAFSSLFSPELQAIGVASTLLDEADGTPAGPPPPPFDEIVAGLPVPRVDSADPAAGYLATLSTLEPAQRTAALRAAVSGDPGTSAAVAESAETHLALARSLIVTGDLADAENVLENLAAAALADWRAGWYQGLRQLAAGRPDNAWAAFDGVYDALPGELAPKLALGFAAEAAADGAAAARWFQLVWTVDRSYVSAAFGLARTRLEAGDRAAAVAALAAVPETSSHHLAAQLAAVRIQVSSSGKGPVSADDLRQAGHRLGRLKLDPGRQLHLTTEVLRAALDCAVAGQLTGGGQLLGCDLTERSLRFGLERAYRTQARRTPDTRRRIELVDRANEIRPRTWS